MTFRVASVSFLNARPLIEGLDHDPRVKLLLDVPSALLELLRDDRADVALLPVIDYQRAEGLTIVPAGGIASDGETLTGGLPFVSKTSEFGTILSCIEKHLEEAQEAATVAEPSSRSAEVWDIG